MAASDLAVSQLRMQDIFYEIPVCFSHGSTLARNALEQGWKGEDTGLDRLVLDHSAYLEKNVQFTSEELDRLKSEAYSSLNFQKHLAKQKVQQDRWLMQRRQENVLRETRGEEPLPLKDPSLSFFKTYRDQSKMGSLLVRRQLGVYCEQMDEWTSESFEKLYLVGAVQNLQMVKPDEEEEAQ